MRIFIILAWEVLTIAFLFLRVEDHFIFREFRECLRRTADAPAQLMHCIGLPEKGWKHSRLLKSYVLGALGNAEMG